MAYVCALKMRWSGHSCSRGHVREKTTPEAQTRRSVRAGPIDYKFGQRNNLEGARNAFNVVLRTLADFPDPADDVSIIDEGKVEESIPWQLQGLTYKNENGRSRLYHVQLLSKANDYAVTSGVWFVQKLMKDSIAALASDKSDKVLLAQLKKTFDTNNTESGRSSQAYDNKIFAAGHRNQE